MRMRKALDEALCRDFPLTFRDRQASSTVTSMCWGFPGDGWEPLIRRAAETIEAAIRQLPASTRAKTTSTQVKNKLGLLRWYMKGATAEMDAAIDQAEEESARTCENCGAPGTLTGNATLCGLCWA